MYIFIHRKGRHGSAHFVTPKFTIPSGVWGFGSLAPSCSGVWHFLLGIWFFLLRGLALPSVGWLSFSGLALPSQLRLRSLVLGLRVQGLGFGFRGCGVWDLGFAFGVLGFYRHKKKRKTQVPKNWCQNRCFYLGGGGGSRLNSPKSRTPSLPPPPPTSTPRPLQDHPLQDHPKTPQNTSKTQNQKI